MVMRLLLICWVSGLPCAKTTESPRVRLESITPKNTGRSPFPRLININSAIFLYTDTVQFNITATPFRPIRDWRRIPLSYLLKEKIRSVKKNKDHLNTHTLHPARALIGVPPRPSTSEDTFGRTIFIVRAYLPSYQELLSGPFYFILSGFVADFLVMQHKASIIKQTDMYTASSSDMH